MDTDSEDLTLHVVLGRGDLSGIENAALDLDIADLVDYLDDDDDKTGSYLEREATISDLKICDTLKSERNHPSNFTPRNSTLPLHSQPPGPVFFENICRNVTEPSTIPSLISSPKKANHQNVNVSLPESPPDSGSEPPFSPAHPENVLNGSEGSTRIPTMMQSTGDLKYMGYSSTQPLKHLSETSLTLTPPLPLPNPPQSVQSSLPQHSSMPQTLSAVPSQSASVGSMLSHLQHPIPSSLPPGMGLQPQTLGPSTPHLTSLYDSNDEFLCESLDNGNNNHKKRKLSGTHKSVVNSSLLNGMMSVKREGGGISPEPHTNTPVLSATDDEYSFDFSGPDGSGMFLDSSYQCIRFQPFQQNTWAILCDHTLKELPPPNFRVDADKGFNFSNADESFVCQKKNHFQVTVHVQPVGEPHYVKTPDGVKKIDHFFLSFGGVKVESPNQTIKVEQSQSDRSKRPFHPVLVDLTSEQVFKTTVGRLHFSETTSNNMRKKGKPNPDQRYFYLVVSLCVASGELNYTISAHASERIIVRASNPGQFENDMELSWQRGQLADSIYHAGRVGINTDRPDEALVVHGSMKVTGHIVHPSDARAKTNIEEVDTREQLKNVVNMRIVRYQYLPEFAKHVGLGEEDPPSTGVIAQEVRTLIPEAVQGTGDIVLPDGQHIENFLVVDKDRIFMENVGAVKELCKMANNLGTRIDQLEKVNKKLSRHQRIKRFESFKSTSSGSTITSQADSLKSSKSMPPRHYYQCRKAQPSKSTGDDPYLCSPYYQPLIIALLIIMIFCVLGMAALYFFEWSSRHVPKMPLSFEERAIFDMTSSKLTSPSSFLEVEKSKSSFENSIDVQENKKDNRILDGGRLFHDRRGDVFAATSAKPATLSMSPSPRSSGPLRNLIPTAVPILKPRVVGTPGHCHLKQPPQEQCQVQCCTATRRRTVSNNHQDVGGTGEDGSDIPAFPAPTSEFTDSQSDGSSDQDVYDGTRSLHTEPERQSSTGKPPAVRPQLSAELENHPIDQNQLKPARDPLVLQRLLGDRNDTDDANNAEVAMVDAANPFEQKMRTFLKSENVTKRSKRGTKPFTRKDLTRAIESLRLLELNSSIGLEYCNTLQCAHRNGPSLSYLVPVSKYMVEEYLTLQFSLSVPLIVDHCQPDSKPDACPVPQNGAGDLPHDYIREQNLTEEVDPSWRLPVGLYLKSTYKFRVQARSVVSDTPCSLPESELGHSYIEFILIFQRTCDK